MDEPGGEPAADPTDPTEPTEPTEAGRRSRRLRGSRPWEVGTDPDYRFTLANERTFLSWIRTSLALIAAGVAVVQIAPDLGPRPLRVVLGVALVVTAGAMAIASHYRWAGNERAMRLSQSLPVNRLTLVLGYGLAVVAVAVIVLLLIGRPQ